MGVVCWSTILVAGVLLTLPSSDTAQHAATGRELSAHGRWTGHLPSLLLPDGTTETAWYPGGYHLLATATWGVAGFEGVRLLAVLAYAATALTSYALLRRIGAAAFGLAAVAGLIAAGYAFEYAMEPWVEPMLLPLTAAGLLLSTVISARPRAAATAALALVVGALLGMKQQGWFIIAGFVAGIGLVAAVRRDARLALHLTMASLAGLGLSLPLLAVYARTFLFTDLAREDFFGWYANAFLADPVETLRGLAGLLPAAWPLAAAGGLLLAALAVRYARRKPTVGVPLAAAGAGAAFLAPVWAATIDARVRYWIPWHFLVGMSVCLVLVAIARRWPGRWRAAVPVPLLIVMALMLPTLAAASTYPARFDDSEDQYPGPRGRFTSVVEAGSWVDRELPPDATLLAVRRNEVLLYADRAVVDYPRQPDFRSPTEFADWFRALGVDYVWLDRTRVGSNWHDEEPAETFARWILAPGVATVHYRNRFVDILSVDLAAVEDMPRDAVVTAVDARALEAQPWPVRVEPPARWDAVLGGAAPRAGLRTNGTILLPTNETRSGWIGIQYLDADGSLVVRVRSVGGSYRPVGMIAAAGTWEERVAWFPVGPDVEPVYSGSGNRYAYLGFGFTTTGVVPISAVAFAVEGTSRAWVQDRLMTAAQAGGAPSAP